MVWVWWIHKSEGEKKSKAKLTGKTEKESGQEITCLVFAVQHIHTYNTEAFVNQVHYKNKDGGGKRTVNFSHRGISRLFRCYRSMFK